MYPKVLFLLMDSVNLKDDDPIWSDDMSIRVNGTGQILHAYVNGEYMGKLSSCLFYVSLK